jgi:hypothetical protein
MRSCCTALSLVATAFGGYISAALLVAVNRNTKWLDNLTDGSSRLDLYFFLLAAVMLSNTLVFAGAAVMYKYKVVQHRSPIPLIGGQHSWSVEARPQQVSGVQASSAAAISIGVRPGFGYQFRGTPSTPDVGPYGRSVTYNPQTPIMPAHFR